MADVPVPVPLQTIKSLRDANYYLDQHGYGYRGNSNRNGILYVLCQFGACRARGKVEKVNGELVGFVIRTNGYMHEHEPPHVKLIEFLRKLNHRAEIELIALKRIYDEESTRVEAEVASERPFVDVRRMMAGHRLRVQPKIPQTLPEMCQAIQQHRPEWGLIVQNTPGMNRNFMVACTPEACVFISPRTAQLFNEQGITYTADGTFKITPNEPETYQLYTIGGIKTYNINGVQHKAFIPIVFAILTRKTKELYRWVIQRVKQLYPHWNPDAIMLDFEVPAMDAFRAEFPDENVRVSGCWFHFSQAIQRKMQALKLVPEMKVNEQLRNTLKKFMALALLPPNFVLEGQASIHAEITANGFDGIVGIADLKTYFDNYWMNQVTPQRFSVFASVKRTNNNHEAFHGNIFLHCAEGRGGSSPNVWRFIYALRVMEHAAAIIYAAVQKNKRVTHPRKRKWIAQDDQIRDAYLQLELNPGHLDLRGRVVQFLARAQHFFNFADAEPENDEEVEDPVQEIQNEIQQVPQVEEALLALEPDDEIIEVEMEEIDEIIEIEID